MANKNKPTDKPSREASLTNALLSFAKTHYTVFRNSEGQPFAQHGATRRIYRMQRDEFYCELRRAWYREHKSSLPDVALREVNATLSAVSAEQPVREVFQRIAKVDNAYYIDLGTADGQAVRVRAMHWELVASHEVAFIRSPTMRALPVPVRNGSLDMLWSCVNVTVPDRPLVLAWMLEALRCDTPYPILELTGEQGSAKSTTQDYLRSMVDPNALNLRAPPRNVDELCIAAGAGHVVSFENVSHLSHELQDRMCTIATGGGYAKRQLYSDATEHAISLKNPIILNGIGQAVTNQDLVSRTISLELPPIPHHRDTTQLKECFEAAYPALFGALLDQFALALARLPDVSLGNADTPRLVEFLKLGMALALANGQPAEAFRESLSHIQEASSQRALDGSPLAQALLDWAEKNVFPRELPLKELMIELELYRPTGSDGWPRSPKGLGDALRRLKPALRGAHLELESLGKQGRHCYWRFRRSKPLTLLPPMSSMSQVADGRATCDFNDMGSELFEVPAGKPAAN